MPNEIADSLADVRVLLEQALDSQNGLRLEGTEKGIKLLRQRCYKVRENDRRQSRKSYEPGHVLRGKSPFDVLSFIVNRKPIEEWERDEGPKWELVIERAGAEGLPFGITKLEEI